MSTDGEPYRMSLDPELAAYGTSQDRVHNHVKKRKGLRKAVRIAPPVVRPAQVHERPRSSARAKRSRASKSTSTGGGGDGDPAPGSGEPDKPRTHLKAVEMRWCSGKEDVALAALAEALVSAWLRAHRGNADLLGFQGESP